jgi:hypothetical protein
MRVHITRFEWAGDTISAHCLKIGTGTTFPITWDHARMSDWIQEYGAAGAPKIVEYDLKHDAFHLIDIEPQQRQLPL